MDFTHLLRPQTFDALVAQEHLSAQNAPLRKLCESAALGHSFFYGPPGCGKTSLARIIAKEMQLPFFEFNATSLKIEQLRKVFDAHKNALQKPLIFIDEVHRLSKNQQEVLLPVMENNTILLIGASTENPFFSLTAAMRSRSLLFELKGINDDSLDKLLQRALVEGNVTIEADAKNYLIHSSGHDARAMLKLLEYASAIEQNITLQTLQSLRPKTQAGGSSEAQNHYDLISAMIKSIRGSDADAAIYYLARLIEGGESADFIARRLVILASEDIGNANPQALTLATSAMTSVKNIGFPEARIILAQAIVYLAASPKSNSAYTAINEAMRAVRNGLMLDVPEHIRDSAKNYKYPHDFGGYVAQEYLQQELHFVALKEIGFEAKMKQWLELIQSK